VELELFGVVFGPTAPPRSKKRRFGEWTSILAPNFYYGNSIVLLPPFLNYCHLTIYHIQNINSNMQNYKSGFKFL
jgi:hypothetical protein